MKNTGFLTPNDEFILLKVFQVNDYCKSICGQYDNMEKFQKFREGYNKFDPYFDFVVFELKYIFFSNNNFYVPSIDSSNMNNDMALYEILITPKVALTYENVLNAEKVKFYDRYIPYITKCSDKELSIGLFVDDTSELMGMVDEDGFIYRNKTYEKSHFLISRTILHHFLIKNGDLCLDFEEYKMKSKSSDSLDYLKDRMGFLELDSSFSVVTERELSEPLKVIVTYLEDDKHVVLYDKVGYDSIFNLYKENIFKTDALVSEEKLVV